MLDEDFGDSPDRRRCIFATKAAKSERVAGKIAAVEPDVIQLSRAKSRGGTSVDD
jgi:hypothetical protein